MSAREILARRSFGAITCFTYVMLKVSKKFDSKINMTEAIGYSKLTKIQTEEDCKYLIHTRSKEVHN